MLSRLMMVAPSGSSNWLSLNQSIYYDMVVDSLGNTYAVGYSVSAGKGFLAKISPTNTVLWAKDINIFAYYYSKLTVNPSATFVYLVTGNTAFSPRSISIIKFNADGTVAAQTRLYDASAFGDGYPYSCLADDNFLYIGAEVYGAAGTRYNSIFKISASNLTISSKWGYTNLGRIRQMAFNPNKTAIYICASTVISGSSYISFAKIQTSNLSVLLSKYVSYSLTQGSDDAYSIAVDGSETNIYVAGRGYFTQSSISGYRGMLFSISSNGSTINWNRVTRAGSVTSGYADVAVDASSNIHAFGSFYNGSIYKYQYLKLSSANAILFSNAFDGAEDSDAMYSSAGLDTTNSTIKIQYKGVYVNPNSYGSIHSVPVDGTLTGSYNVGGITVNYSSFVPTYNSVSPSTVNLGTTSFTTLSNYSTTSSSYTFADITINRLTKDIP